MLTNIDDIVDFTIAQNADVDAGSGRIEIFRKIRALFSSVITAVTTVVITGVMTAVGVSGLLLTGGGTPAAIIGGVVGFATGIEMSFYLSCQWGLSSRICADCRAVYPNIIC